MLKLLDLPPPASLESLAQSKVNPKPPVTFLGLANQISASSLSEENKNTTAKSGEKTPLDAEIKQIIKKSASFYNHDGKEIDQTQLLRAAQVALGYAPRTPQQPKTPVANKAAVLTPSRPADFFNQLPKNLDPIPERSLLRDDGQRLLQAMAYYRPIAQKNS